MIIESKYTEAERSLQRILESGLTYDDLIAEGLHPSFLERVFARIQSPKIEPRPPSLPRAPDPHFPVLDAKSKPPSPENTPSDSPIMAAVENFLHTLEPSITTNGKDALKKRGGNSGSGPAPKRRAFGLDPPKELVIDVSDDSDDAAEPAKPVKNAKGPPVQPQPSRRIVKITNRPQLKQKVVFSTKWVDNRTWSKLYGIEN